MMPSTWLACWDRREFTRIRRSATSSHNRKCALRALARAHYYLLVLSSHSSQIVTYGNNATDSAKLADKLKSLVFLT